MARRRVPAVPVLYAGQLTTCAYLLPTILDGGQAPRGVGFELAAPAIERDSVARMGVTTLAAGDRTMGLWRRTKAAAIDYTPSAASALP